MYGRDSRVRKSGQEEYERCWTPRAMPVTNADVDYSRCPVIYGHECRCVAGAMTLCCSWTSPVAHGNNGFQKVGIYNEEESLCT
jgi:hypothetical protein